MSRAGGAATSSERVRLDKWLWAARVYKTRTLASHAIDVGHVRAGDARVKPAHAIRVGDQVSIRKGAMTWLFVVTGLSDRRGSASDAAKLYAETPESQRAREQLALERKAADAAAPRYPGRPTKRDRRKLEDFLSEP